MRTLFSLSVFLVGCASGTDLWPPAPERARSAMEALVSRGFAGSVLVACGGATIFAGDFGLPPHEGRIPSYWIASISKQFTAAAVLKLAEQGRLSLADRLGAYFPYVSADKSDITLMQLATHRSGLSQADAADGHNAREAAARAIFSVPLESAPGTQFRYSNDNYALLAMVVELTSGERIEDYVQQHLLTPAGLTEVGFWPGAGEAYVPRRLMPPGPELAGPNWGMRGSDGMRASVHDLLLWVSALDAGEVLSPESLARLYGPHLTLADGDGVGMGWFWSPAEGGLRWQWTRGTEDTGPNAILYRLWGTPLTIIAATNAGPAEDAGPGWSRQARDALMEIYDAKACG